MVVLKYTDLKSDLNSFRQALVIRVLPQVNAGFSISLVVRVFFIDPIDHLVVVATQHWTFVSQRMRNQLAYVRFGTKTHT